MLTTTVRSHWHGLLLALGAGFALHGCTTLSSEPPDALPEPVAVEDLPAPAPAPVVTAAAPAPVEYSVFRVFYATDRNIENPSIAKQAYGGDRADISYGTCDVSIPRVHRMGMLETPSIWRLEFREDPTRHVVLLNVDIKDEDSYFDELRTRVQNSTRREAFVFVHGYNVTFENAARRTAQIAYDLGFQGAPVFYSWPSQGTLPGYPVDEVNVQWAQANLQRFLADFVARSDAENIYLIAHSMGNRALTRAFGNLVTRRPEVRKRFREIILTAPDIDADVFRRDIAPRIIDERPSVTLYVSSEDRALLASKRFHGYRRAGDSGGQPLIMNGIETVDASGVDTSFLKHSYFAEATSVLGDMFHLIRDGVRAGSRTTLRAVTTPEGLYWAFRR